MDYYKADTYFLFLPKFAVMLQNDPLPESKKPVLIVSDGEEGNLVEKVIIPKKGSTPKPPTSVQKIAEDTNDTDLSDGNNIPPDKKGF